MMVEQIHLRPTEVALFEVPGHQLRQLGRQGIVPVLE